jgi:hypothetical protein
VSDQRAEQDEDGKSDYQVGRVNEGKDLIVPDVAKNVDEKMSDHGFEYKFGFFLNYVFAFVFGLAIQVIALCFQE